MKTRHYLLRNNREEFLLWRVMVKDGCSELRWKVITQRYLARVSRAMLRGMQIRDGPFLLASLVLTTGEHEQRYRQKVKLNPDTTYTRQNVLKCYSYVRTAMKKGGQELAMSTSKKINQLLSDVFAPLRSELGFPDHNPARVFYVITDEVIACADDAACQHYLEQQGALGPITEVRFSEIMTELHLRYPEDADYVIKAIKKQRSREPLSLISLDVRKGVFLITLVTPDGALLQLDDSRFIELLRQANTPLLLAYHTKQDTVAYKDRPVVFKNQPTGRIVAKFMPDTSRISVVCLHEERDEVQDKAFFIIDADYLLCLFIVLERLREDQVEYRRMKERAEVSLVGIDPFEKLYY